MVYNFLGKDEITLSNLLILLSLANSEDPDEMPQYAAFHLGLHCLQNTSLLVSEMKDLKMLTLSISGIKL